MHLPLTEARACSLRVHCSQGSTSAGDLLWPRVQEFLRLAGDMVAGRETPPGPPPPDLLPRQWSFLGPVVLDTVPHGALSYDDTRMHTCW